LQFVSDRSLLARSASDLQGKCNARTKALPLRKGTLMMALRIALNFTAAAVLATVARADILVGVVGPMSGEYASFGDQMKVGAEAAIADINAAGGVLGQKLAIDVEDDACDPRQAVSAANLLIEHHVSFVYGHFCSGSTIPASSIYAESKIPEVTVSSNPKVVERGLKTIYQITARDDQEAITAADHLVEGFAGKKIALIDDRSAFGKGLVDVVTARLKEKGVTPVLNLTVTPGERDMSAIVSRLKDADVGVVFLGGYHTEAGLLVRQAAEAGAHFTLLGADALATSDFWSVAGPAGEGTQFVFLPDPRHNPAADAVVKRFRTEGKEPEGWTIYAYAAVQLFAEAANKAKSSTWADLDPVFRHDNLPTAVGPVTFSDNGERTNFKGFVVYTWRDGKYAPLTP
jgi:branched-chain amino acid transport system substrate-binding protein